MGGIQTNIFGAFDCQGLMLFFFFNIVGLFTQNIQIIDKNLLLWWNMLKDIHSSFKPAQPYRHHREEKSLIGHNLC